MNINKVLAPSPTFLIVLYQNKAEENRVNKSAYLTEIATLSGALRDTCSIINPSIVIELTQFPTFNYVVIPKFKRYYFVQNITSISKNLWRIDLRLDVLMSYYAGITSLNAIVSRQEFDYNPLLTDGEMPVENGVNIVESYIDSGADITKFNINTEKYRYILTAFSDYTTTGTRSKFEKTFLTNAKYLMNEAQVIAFLKKLNNPDFKTSLDNVFANTPMEGIISLRAYPIDIGTLWNIGSQESDDITIGSYTTGAKGYLYVINPDEKCTIKVARFRPPLSVTWQDYTDELTVYLPFYGFVDIDAREFYTAQYYDVYYVIDFDTGVTTINIYRQGASDIKLVQTLSTSIAVDIALSATNATETIKNVLNFGMMTALTIGTTLATGGAATPVVTGAIMGAGREIASMQQHIRRGTNAGGAWGGVNSPLRPYLITAKRKYKEPALYASLHGRPSMLSVSLGTQVGFTKIESVHIEGTGFESITQDEKTLLETQLKNGIIFEKTKLATPTGLKFNSTAKTLTWNAVLNAAEYDVYINNKWFTMTDIPEVELYNYDLPDGLLTAKVKATNPRYTDSDFSTAVTFNHKTPLPAPVISATGSVVSWNAIPNAILYRVYLENFEGLTAEYSVENATTTDISTMWEGMADGDVYVAITANPGADSFEWSNSPRSNQITVVKASTVTLEAGTYKWNDTLTLPSVTLEQDLSFTDNNDSSFTGIYATADDVRYNTGGPQEPVYFNNEWGEEYYKTITLSTSQTVSAEFYNWAITQGNLVKQAEGETWLLNESLDLLSYNGSSWTIKFTSNNTNYSQLNIVAPSIFQQELYYGATSGTCVYDSPGGWTNTAYRIITFAAPPAGNLVKWLRMNGTKQ